MKPSPQHTAALILALALFAAPVVRAGIVDSSAAGFTVHTTVVVKAAPDDAYRAVAESIAKWWDSGHTYSGNARNLSIDVLNTGCFCETLENGGIVRHMTVVYASPGKTLRLQGGLGPVQELAGNGTLTWQFKTSNIGTAIEMTYTVAGYDPAGVGRLAGAVDRVLALQMDRLKNFIDTGNPEPAAGK